MSNFLYYIPNGPGVVTLDVARQHGLGYAFDGPTIASAPTERGPDDGKGIVCTAGGPDAMVPHVTPAEQTWQKDHQRDFWVGLDRRRIPGPDDLARREMLGGHDVRLGDGNEWLSPIARGMTEEDDLTCWYEALPRKATFVDGVWTAGDVLERYAPLRALAIAWDDIWMKVRTLVAAGKPPVVDTGEFDPITAATEILAFNYTLGPVEASLLGLWNIAGGFAAEAQEVLCAAIDWPVWLRIQTEVQKKTDPGPSATSTTDAGPPAAVAATGPQ